jgi:hypothetical protein
MKAIDISEIIYAFVVQVTVFEKDNEINFEHRDHLWSSNGLLFVSEPTNKQLCLQHLLS